MDCNIFGWGCNDLWGYIFALTCFIGMIYRYRYYVAVFIRAWWKLVVQITV